MIFKYYNYFPFRSRQLINFWRQSHTMVLGKRSMGCLCLVLTIWILQ